MMRAKFAYRLLKKTNNKTNLARSDNFDLYKLLKYNIKNRKLVHNNHIYFLVSKSYSCIYNH